MLKKLAKKFKKEVKDEKNGRQNIGETVENVTEAVPFEKARFQEEVPKIIQETEAIPKKILVVSHENWFSKRVVEYALGFAERMGYEIVAMNVLEIPQKSEAIAPYCSLMEEKFKSSSQESVAEFAKSAESRNIPFLHIVKVGDVNTCIKETVQEVRNIEFVISDPETLPEIAREGVEDVIPVYAVTSIS